MTQSQDFIMGAAQGSGIDIEMIANGGYGVLPTNLGQGAVYKNICSNMMELQDDEGYAQVI